MIILKMCHKLICTLICTLILICTVTVHWYYLIMNKKKKQKKQKKIVVYKEYKYFISDPLSYSIWRWGCLGKITKFDKANEDWVSYVERMALFFEANRTEKEMKKKGYFAIQCWITVIQTTKKFISVKQTISYFKNNKIFNL